MPHLGKKALFWKKNGNTGRCDKKKISLRVLFVVYLEEFLSEPLFSFSSELGGKCSKKENVRGFWHQDDTPITKQTFSINFSRGI